MSNLRLAASASLPRDGYAGALAGRIWRPDVGGPSVVALRADGVFDVSDRRSHPSNKLFPGLRQCDGPGRAVKQAYVQAGFQGTHCVTQSRRGYVERACGRAETTLVRDCNEGRQFR